MQTFKYWKAGLTNGEHLPVQKVAMDSVMAIFRKPVGVNVECKLKGLDCLLLHFVELSEHKEYVNSGSISPRIFATFDHDLNVL